MYHTPIPLVPHEALEERSLFTTAFKSCSLFLVVVIVASLVWLNRTLSVDCERGFGFQVKVSQMSLDFFNFFPCRNESDVEQTDEREAHLQNVHLVEVVKIISIDMEEQSVPQ